MIIKKAELETVCGISSRIPESSRPEVAFAGKSNVGKSSLINGLLNRKSLARTSSQPGKTQPINYYIVSGIRAGYHSHEAGQDQAESGVQTAEDSERRAGSETGYENDSVFCGDQAGA